MFRKTLALLEAIHVGLSAARTAYEEAIADSEPATPPVEAVIDMQSLVREMDDRVLTRILQSRAQMEAGKQILN